MYKRKERGLQIVQCSRSGCAGCVDMAVVIMVIEGPLQWLLNLVKLAKSSSAAKRIVKQKSWNDLCPRRSSTPGKAESQVFCYWGGQTISADRPEDLWQQKAVLTQRMCLSIWSKHNFLYQQKRTLWSSSPQSKQFWVEPDCIELNRLPDVLSSAATFHRYTCYVPLYVIFMIKETHQISDH